uniref:Coagulation factor VIII-like n=1 Tax=Sparus aurata TaxID=8175 RepID=A0A671W8Q5_SPAAU
MIGVGTAPEIHSIQFQAHSLEVLTHRKVTMEVTPMTFITAEMKPVSVGRFLISCQIYAHRHDGMNALFVVEKCPDPIDMRNVKDEEDSDDYLDDSLFNTVSFQPTNPKFQARASRGQRDNTWEHFIAVEEVTWDYAHKLKPTDSELQSAYLPAAPHHLGYRYKKVQYVEYTDASFTQRKENPRSQKENPEEELLGPLLKGKINDEIHVSQTNLASRPFNIYPTGLTRIFPLHRSTNEKDLRSMGVPPNRTFTYVWKLTPEDGPLDRDPQCLTQLYQSTVSLEKDLASGLVGALLICKNEAIDTRGRLVGPDKEWPLIFAVFDENISWYIDDNLEKSSKASPNTTDPEFYSSNVIYSVNGHMFSGRQFVICKTDVTFWHVANVGTQSDFLSVYFTGNLFQYQGLYQSVLTLFPMTGMTISMESEVIGEWEISAFDGSLKSRGMSIIYTVLPCDNGDLPLVDRDEMDEDLSQYIDKLVPRGRRPQNRTASVRECKRPLVGNNTGNISGQNVTDDNTERTPAEEQSRCKDIGDGLEGGIPEDVLEELLKDGDWMDSQNGTEAGGQGGVRQRRQAEGNGTDVEISSGASEDGGTVIEIGEQDVEKRTDTVTSEEISGLSSVNNEGIGREIRDQDVEKKTNTFGEVKSEEGSEMSGVNNETKGELEVSNEILLNSNPATNKASTSGQTTSEEMDQNHIQSKPERLEVNSTSGTLGTDYMDLRSGEVRFRHYYIAAEEVTWDYGIRKPHQLLNPREVRRGMRKFLPAYKKVVFRAYKDEDFRDPVDRGELQEHLGIMGPFIRTEINNLLTVIFKNKASRPYSFHLQGVYDRTQGAGMAQTTRPSAPLGVPGEPLAPGETRTYNWKITKKQGPTDSEFDCKTWAYYSTVDKERDLHSGLIGPLVICKPGTLLTRQYTQPDVQEFSLLFHTFDETKSWYMEENLARYCAPPCQANTEDPWYHISNKFAAINGYVAETLPGLMVAQHQRVRWHLLNVGNDEEYHAVLFHGLPFTVHTKETHRMGVYSLFPGVFGTVEMRPPTVGTWLVECTIGDYQLAGMRAKLLVYNPNCVSPLGMKSGRIEDSQITASDYVGKEPRLARLDQSGYINAWIGRDSDSWIQVDLLKPTLLHGIQTQGVRVKLRDNYITFFTVSYSLDQDTWRTYKGNTTNKMFRGNMDSSKVKSNAFTPPFVARYVRIQPQYFKQRPALRLELLGCDVNSCSLPLGLQRGTIPDKSLTASSFYSSLLSSWKPALARLHQEGRVNAWRPKNNNPHEWLQVDLGKVKRITGVVTQGVRSMLTQMMVTEFSVTVSHDEHSWSSVLEADSQREKIFAGNNDSDEEAVTVFDPPLFGRYLRIHPLGWINGIALRLEVLGCDTQQVL